MKEVNLQKADIEQLRRIAQIDIQIEELREDAKMYMQSVREEIKAQLALRAKAFEEINQLSLPT